MSKKVLITDCWTRNALCAVRALGLAGYEVHAVTHTRLSPAVYSKHAKKHFLFSRYGEDPVLDWQRLLTLMQKERYACILPMNEYSVRLFLENKAEAEACAAMALPSLASFNAANDKWRTLQLAESLGIPIPQSTVANSPEDALAFARSVGFPCIIKPRSSSGSRGLRKIPAPETFLAAWHDVKKTYGAPIVQKCIAQHGQGAGVGVIMDRGSMIASLSYKRLREYPVAGGPSTLRESTDNPELKRYAVRLLEALQWHGVAMVEFKYDPQDGRYKLMEINPRFWGSLHLACVAGINFPLLYCKLAMREEIEPQRYTVGVRSRWLIPGDMLHFLSNAAHFRRTPSFFDFFDPRTHHDQYLRGDPAGNLAVVVCAVLSVLSPQMWRIAIFRR